MQTLSVEPGNSESLRLVEAARPSPRSGEVLVGVLEVGIDGTDKALLAGKHGKPPPGQSRLIVGHEVLGRVAALGPDVKELRIGDLVTATVRRPCPERCPFCAAGQVDLCSTGHYSERGIVGAHGYASDFFVDRTEWLVRVPETLRQVGVLTEPVSIAEKGIERAFAFQSGIEWRPRKALVLGAGSLGLLAALLLRGRDLEVTLLDRGDPEGPKARLVRAMDSSYVQTDGRPLRDLLGSARFDFIFEATGVSSLIFQAVCLLDFNGVLCVAGLPEGNQRTSIPGDCIGLEMVLENHIIFGTVSSNRGQFERSLAAMENLERRFPSFLSRILTGRFRAHRFADAFQPAAIKNTLVFSEDDRE